MKTPYDDIIDSKKPILNLQKPATFGNPVTFPESVDGLSTEKLGNLMFQLTAYRGYALYQLAIVDVNYSGAKSLYEDRFRVVVSTIDTAKKTQVVIQQEVLDADSELRDLKMLQDRLAAEVAMLDRLQKIYEIQITTLSRELSRRSMEIEQSKISPGA